MNFTLNQSIELLERTPYVFEVMLRGLSPEWTNATEGPDTWSPYDIIGHLIHGEKTDWIPRLEIILSDQQDREFPAFDRSAQFTESAGKSMLDLLSEFKTLRGASLAILRAKGLTAKDLARTGVHPAFGTVTLAQLLATWTAHDLDHVSQISRVMAKRYTVDVGPWMEYLKILRS